MGAFTTTNVFPTESANRAWAAVLVLFLLWWIAILVHGLLSGLLKPRSTVASNGQVIDDLGRIATTSKRGRWELHTRDAADALQIVFLSAFVVTTVNHLVNGVSKGFMILLWIQVWVGFFWAILRGPFRRFADVLLVIVIPLFITMWALAFRGAISAVDDDL
ncbi:hypothetical protein DFJ77DRAFT_514704 [Powellomyces hirtus]|nr:hypothetical protein DFJ77DRAFT_514704 [Powellomyces hirtus]